MITKERFVEMMELINQFSNEVDRWYQFGINIIEQPIDNIPWEMFNSWKESHFDEYGCDWIDWYLFERKSLATGEILPCYDENGVEFYVNNSEDLWNLVKDYQLTSLTINQ